MSDHISNLKRITDCNVIVCLRAPFLYVPKEHKQSDCMSACENTFDVRTVISNFPHKRT